MDRLRVLALEPYYGGSHRAFLDTWIAHSQHEWTLCTLPAHHWKWRMRGSALWFADTLADTPAGRFDLLFTCDMTSVADLRALLPRTLRSLPIVCYFHENQLTYPLSPHDWRDYQFGLTNITSAMASEAVWFNSQAHRRAFLEAAHKILRKMPDYVPLDTVQRIEARSSVQYPVVEPPQPTDPNPRLDPSQPVRILWSHRWEYDKNPECFFRVMARLAKSGARFELVLLGEQFRTAPAGFRDACQTLGDVIVHAGYAESRQAYWTLVGSCDLVVSTAIQENFGLSVVEAMMTGCLPLFPQDLSYPELLPLGSHRHFLYADENDLLRRLQAICEPDSTSRARFREAGVTLPAQLGERFAAGPQTKRLDAALCNVGAAKQPPPSEPTV